MSDAPPAVPAERPEPQVPPPATSGAPAPDQAPPREKPDDGRPTPHPSYLFLALLSLVVLASDLLSKWWAVRALEKSGIRLPAKEIIKGRLSFVLARNPGGAWGMLHDQPEKVRRPFFLLVSVIAVAVIVGMYRKLDPKQHALRWGLPLVLGGAVGNFVDRIRYGQVIDFIDVIYWKKAIGLEMHWPTFNVADIAICVGVGLMAIDFLFPQKRPKPRRVASTAK